LDYWLFWTIAGKNNALSAGFLHLVPANEAISRLRQAIASQRTPAMT